ncbi:MAG: hypothetical protein KDB53_00935 [Planctomycetes bacterium]|nr:hypothetical protein [Planctomycetota bacterium]
MNKDSIVLRDRLDWEASRRSVLVFATLAAVIFVGVLALSETLYARTQGDASACSSSPSSSH